MQASLISCMPPSMACGVTSRECARSFSSVSNNTGGVLVEEEFQLPCHGESFMGSPPEMGGDDGDLHHITTGPSDPPPPVAKKKRKRSLPGTPDPSAEVIALSPTTLMATNRFVCEICHKGFQRDQNLQLHRRGHNLPWKLRQRGAGGEGGATGAPPRKRVYVCPEPSCVHHSPGRALGDLTGIKKHFCRKHGEKKWKCDRCAKRYAVHSDWKAHSKVCGTREYKCDCGTVFSRRDSFVTHRAFCDALARENNKLAQPAMNMATVASALQGQLAAHHLMLPSHADDVAMETDANDNATGFVPDIKSPHLKTFSDDADVTAAAGNPLGCMLSSLGAPSPSAFNRSRLSLLGLAGPGDATAGSFSPSGPASMSATALLQKAAEMGATTTSGYGAGFSSTGLGSTMVGLDRFFTSLPFAPRRAHGLYDGLVGFGVDAPMPGQLYDGGAHGVGSTTTRAIRSMTHGGDQTTEVRRAGDVVRVVDYMGVEEQRAFEGVSPFVRHMDPWA